MSVITVSQGSGPEAADPENGTDGRAGNHGLIYRFLRDDIIEGRLASGSRLKVSELAERYGTSTNPVREALHQLQGEGFVVINRNRGASVRSIDESFVRNLYEITALVEPYLAQWFADYVSDDDIRRLERLQETIESGGFDDPEIYSTWDEKFHRVAYDRHYNQEAVTLWERKRGILRAISRNMSFSIARREAILREHRALIEAFKRHDGAEAARITEQHVRGAGRHLVERLRTSRTASQQP